MIKHRISIKHFLIKNKWLLAYLFWLCGWILVYASFLLDQEERNDLIMYNSIFFILCSFAFLWMTGWIRRLGLIVFSILAIPPSLIETGWFLMDKSTLIRNQFYVIFATNPAEVGGLLSMIQVWQWGLLSCYSCITIVFLAFAIYESGKKTNYVHSIIAGLFIVSLILIPGLRNNVPCLSFYNSYRIYCTESKLIKNFLQSRPDITGQVHNNFPDSTATIVIIIGESLSRTHCSLYEYCRPTTPRLDNRHDIHVYNDIQSASFMTQDVLRQILSFNNEDIMATWSSPTLPELLNATGWHTYWFDPYEGRRNTSHVMPTSFSAISRFCATFHICDESEKFDETYLNYLDTLLKDYTMPRKAIFLHLIGNHFPYERRYPQTFKYFNDRNVCSQYKDILSFTQIKTINAYDDAVRYNDWLIDSIINRLSEQEECCAMLYFSDHGEEVYDEDLYAGRSYNHITPNLYKIPCLLWYNDAYALHNLLYIDTSYSYCTKNMIHSMLDLFAVSYCKKDTCRSLFRHRLPASKLLNSVPER